MADLTDSTFTYKTMIWDIYDFGRLIQIFIMCLNGKKTIIAYSNVMDFFFGQTKVHTVTGCKLRDETLLFEVDHDG